MFSDFISKKMIPKNLNEKLEVLFVDETLIKKIIKNYFLKKNQQYFQIQMIMNIVKYMKFPNLKFYQKEKEIFLLKKMIEMIYYFMDKK